VAKFVAKDYDITINGTDFSSSLAAVTLSLTSEEQETTAFGNDYRQRIGGLKDASISLDFHQDFGAASVDATLFPLLGSNATVVVKPTSAAIGTVRILGSLLCTSARNTLHTILQWAILPHCRLNGRLLRVL